MSNSFIHAAQIPSPSELKLTQDVQIIPDNTQTPPEQTAPGVTPTQPMQTSPRTAPMQPTQTSPRTTPMQPMQTSPGAMPSQPMQTPTDTVQLRPIDSPYAGGLQVSVISALGLVPIEGASVIISYGGDQENPIETLITDSSGQTETVQLPAPPLQWSLTPDNEEQPYSEYDILVTAEGYEPVLVTGSEILADELSLQLIRMNPLESTEEEEKIVVIPAHTLFGDYPAKIPEDEIKPMAETGEIVLSRVVIPEYIIVHDGVPMDPTAPNYWVRYKDYIKNVASCEIYSTWPEAAIYANILAIMSFTLNRVYTEWYRNRHSFMVAGV